MTRSVSHKTGIDYDARAVAVVDCPRCGAARGSACVTGDKTGALTRKVKYTHRERRREAAKIAREQRYFYHQGPSKKESSWP